MKITRKDVAKYAGVSEQTVSYVLNDSRKFSDEVVKKVREAIEVLHYKPDMIAKSMVTKKTHTVAILVRDMANPIFPAVVHGFQERASEFGYSVYISDIAGGVDVNSQISDLVSRRIDGVYLSLVSEDRMNEIVEKFVVNDIKVVLGNKDKNVNYDVSCVRTDFSAGMRKIVDYLFRQGHQEIVYVSGLNINADNDERYMSFVSAYKEIFGTEPYVIENDAPYTTTVEDGIRLTEKLLRERVSFSAIVATNDLMAYGVIDCLTLHGKRIPEDVSVVGIDDILYSKYINPPLTTLGYDYRQLGRESFDALKFKIDNNADSDRLIDTYIVERSTVKKIK